MYPLDSPAVYVHESVTTQERLLRRVEGVLGALATRVEPVVFGDGDLPAMVRDGRLLAGREPMGTLDLVRDPILLFHTFRFDGRFAERHAALKAAGCDVGEGLARPLLGYGAFHWARYNLEGDPARHDKVCRPCWRIHLQNGCVHRCLYCTFGGLLVSMVNVEDYCRELGRIIEKHPWQRTFLLDDDGDPPCLEPEHGTLGPLIEFFGSQPDRYLVIHTKTWNTSWMPDVAHNGHTIIVWSLSGPTQSRVLEPGTGTTEQRVQAARIAQQAGYQIRYKFKPIIPVRSWREEAAYAVRLAMERTRPDIISLCVFMWHDVDEMIRRIGTEELDPVFLKAAQEALEETRDTRAQPFPAWARSEIYRHYLAEIRKYDRDIPVSLSTENFAMWKALGPELGCTATNYVCGCGPQSVPGAKTLKDHPFQIAVRDDEGIPGTYV